MGLNKVGMGPNIAAHRDESSVHPDRTQGLVLRLEHGTGYATPNGRTGWGERRFSRLLICLSGREELQLPN